MSTLSEETETLSQVLSLVEAFRAFDSDNDGSITCAELGGILSSLGYSKPGEDDVRAMMQQGDSDKDGLLSLEEFLEMNTKDMGLGSLGNLLKSAIESLDDNSDGETLTGDELHQAMENFGVGLSLGDCRNIIASIDADGDGAVSFDDFQLILNSLL